MLSTLSDGGRKVLRERPGWIPLDDFISRLERGGTSRARKPKRR
ncbi:MAG: hypothetical protein ACREH7_01900 [Candidatus Rokuibacteriota bacterium]